MMQLRTMEKGPGSTSLLVFLCCVALCQTYGIGEYMVDCSACNSVPTQGVKSYSCKVRCQAQGEADVIHLIVADPGGTNSLEGVRQPIILANSCRKLHEN